MCECGELVQYSSWAGVVLYAPSRGASLPRISASVYCTRPRAVRASKGFALLCTVRAPGALRGASLQRLLCLCVPYERQELCAVRASTGFVPLCAVRASRASCGANLQRLSTVRAYKGFLPCEATKAFYRVRAPRALRGASLQRLSNVYERQELCAVRASKSFVPLCAVRASRATCGASLQRLVMCSCTRALRGASLQKLCASVRCKSLTSYVRCEPTKACYVLVYKNLYICTVCTSSHDICSQELYNWYCS